MKRFVFVAFLLVGAWLRLHQIATLPPAPGHDPAYYGLDAVGILDGNLAVYFASNFGREALFSYIVALFYAATGVGALGIHLAAAFIGIITLPIILVTATELFNQEDSKFMRRYGGGIAMLALSLSFWHLIWSRYGVRAILVPPVVALVVLFLLRAIRRDRWCNWVAVGITVGVGFYTYQVAQLLPFVVAGMMFLLLIQRRWRINEWLKRSFLMAFTSALILLPLGLYIANNPGGYNERVRGVSLVRLSQSVGTNLSAIFTQMRGALSTFGWAGDPQPVTNVVGRPTLFWFLFVAAVIGLVLVLWRWREPHFQLILLMLLVMLIPAFLADQGPVPKRVIGTLPILMICAALGIGWLVDRLMNFGRIGTLVGVSIVLVGFMLQAIDTYKDYFLQWGQDPALYSYFQVNMTGMGMLVREIAADTQVYISPHEASHPSIRLAAYPHNKFKSYNGRSCLPFVQQTTQPIVYVLDPDAGDASLVLLESYFPDGSISAESLDPASKRRNALAYTIPANSSAQFTPQNLVHAIWDQKIQLQGWDSDNAIYEPGQSIYLNLYFSAEQTITNNYTLFVHLIGTEVNPTTGNNLWAQYDKEPCFTFYPTSSWAEGEIIRDTVQVQLATALPPGNYRVHIGWYSWPQLTRLQAIDSLGQKTDSVAIGTLTVKER